MSRQGLVSSDEVSDDVPDAVPKCRASVAWLVASAFLLAPSAASAQIPDSLGAGSRCTNVVFDADAGRCSEDRCELFGAVQLRCDALRLWADEVTVDIGKDRSFGGAEARGRVLMVDGDTVTRCKALRLGADRVHGRIEDADIRIKAPGARPGPGGVPEGRDASIFTGDISRDRPDHLVVEDGTYTQCDCGDDPPSWKITSPEIDATLDDRATIYWPMLWVSPFGLFEMPLSPPLLPVSIPLKPRAAGFLQPSINVRGGVKPMIDLPFFVPLGESWDVTLAPGLRMDWGTQALAPSTWGAPRLGLRLRHAAHPTTNGSLTAQYTYDGAGGAARNFRVTAYEGVATATGVDLGIVRQLCHGTRAPNNDAETAAFDRCAGITETSDDLAELVHRVQIELWQDWHPVDAVRLTLDGRWLSDDNIPGDFGVNLSDTVPTYITSRAALSVALPSFFGQLAVDHLLFTGGDVVRDNTHGAERNRGHRAPALGLELLPVHLLQGLHVAAKAGAVRYGPWRDDFMASQWVMGGEAGGYLLRNLGPLRIRGEARAQTYFVDGKLDDAVRLSTVRTGLELSTLVAGRLGPLTHTLEPRLTYRGMPWAEHLAGDPGGVSERRFDERLAVTTFQQAAVGLRQQWLPATSGAPVFSLDLSQPVDLVDLGAAPLHVGLSASYRSMWFSGWAATAWRKPAEAAPPADGSTAKLIIHDPLEDVGASIGGSYAGFSLSGEYVRSSPSADRFNRSIEELAATGALTAPAPSWVHNLNLSVGASHPWGRLGYRAWLLLPLADGSDLNRPLVSQHTLEFSYVSPCQCWSIGATLNLFPMQGTFNTAFQIGIGEFQLGV